ncbi:MAG: TIGR02757 family protein [Flavobacteriaceae bacterium]|nr:TIGR02757 family protein [Flavobacteriaceae bacterium]
MNKQELKSFLDFKSQHYESEFFIAHDPIQIPHQFSKKEDIEIAGFLTATIAWGNRVSILKSAEKMMDIMEGAPHDFVLHHKTKDLNNFRGFVHRTFNEEDIQYFIRSLSNIYKHHGGLEGVFSDGEIQIQERIHRFKQIFFKLNHLPRTQKHVSDPFRGSAAKRINMFLRWMVRSNEKGVDFGLWKKISPSMLSIPLDVHTGNVARKLKLLKRKQNDAKALQSLDLSLRKFDPDDPVKYDFALFGLGAFEKF